jgi:hypothetical protein
MKTIAIVALCLSATANAEACSTSNPPTEQELFSRATSVFRARVTEARLSRLANPANPAEQVDVVEARYEVKEVFRGTPPSAGFVRDLPFGPGNCSLGVLPGMEYVFFPGEHDLVLIYSGSFGYFNPDGSEVKQHLEALRHMSATGTQ